MTYAITNTLPDYGTCAKTSRDVGIYNYIGNYSVEVSHISQLVCHNAILGLFMVLLPGSLVFCLWMYGPKISGEEEAACMHDGTGIMCI